MRNIKRITFLGSRPFNHLMKHHKQIKKSAYKLAFSPLNILQTTNTYPKLDNLLKKSSVRLHLKLKTANAYSMLWYALPKKSNIQQQSN